MTTAIASILKPRAKDLGGFEVRRLLPGFPTKMVGPFIFFDHVGPADFAPGAGIDVRPHPHIGLATVTYLFEGGLIHRDSLGSVQRITAGDVNWMTAGSGIVHSERTAPEDRAIAKRIHGIQTWVALPKTHEQTEPSFSHHPRSTLPTITLPGVQMTLIAGSAFAKRAPTPTFSDMFYISAKMEPGATFELPPEHEERAVYAVQGEIRVDGGPVPPLHLTVFKAGASVEIRAVSGATIMLLGGARLDSDRLIWWNFVASSKELIEDGKVRWKEQRFASVPGENDFIPLPDR
jgi:redox-sensitive bicupin YhaK (pirin superfamily)